MDRVNTARVVTEGEMRLSAPPKRVFPLLCPVREHEWIETWSARIVHTDSGVAEPGCVFVTENPGGPDTVWTVSRYEPDLGVIEFVMVTPGLHVATLGITLEPAGDGTRAVWRRSFTALSAEGGRLVAASVTHVQARLRRLEAQLEHYLETGTMLRS